MGLSGYGDCCGDGAVGMSSCIGDGASCTGDFFGDSMLTCCSKALEPTPSPESLALHLTAELGVVFFSFLLVVGGVSCDTGGVSSEFYSICSVGNLRRLEEEAPSVKVLFLATLRVNVEAEDS